jgi:hypothetical protein
VQSIKKIIDDISVLPKDELESMYREMAPILEHNYTTYKNLSDDKILKAFGLL